MFLCIQSLPLLYSDILPNYGLVKKKKNKKYTKF